mmetsp:Transcript_31678/g.79956  ORF Transcript_31678/g.79956 Transcript_31678/m.79956 type:complete len:336 (+) Transcript_31678:592-1599(+)
MVFWSHRSGSPSSTSSGTSNRPSCTGCNIMSHNATDAHKSVVAQLARRKCCRCFPGNALSVSLRTTNSGSSKSTRMSRQASNQTAAKSTTSKAKSAHKCQVFRCGKQITRATEAAASRAMHVKNSPDSGGRAASPTLGGFRPQAATAATKQTAETRYAKFCHMYAWPGESASARMTQSCGPSAAASWAAASAAGEGAWMASSFFSSWKFNFRHATTACGSAKPMETKHRQSSQAVTAPFMRPMAMQRRMMLAKRPTQLMVCATARPSCNFGFRINLTKMLTLTSRPSTGKPPASSSMIRMAAVVKPAAHQMPMEATARVSVQDTQKGRCSVYPSW